MLKNKARKYFNTRIAREIIENLSIDEILHQSVALPQIKLITKKDSVVILETFWEEIDEELIRQAWIDSVLKYFIYFQNKTEENYALDQNELQKLIDSDRFMNDYNEEEEQEDESEFSYDEINDETLPALRNNTEMLAEYQSNNQPQHESMIVNAESIEVLMRIHFQYIMDFEKFYINKKINDKQKTLQRQQKAIRNLIALIQHREMQSRRNRRNTFQQNANVNQGQGFFLQNANVNQAQGFFQHTNMNQGQRFFQQNANMNQGQGFLQ